MMDLSINNHNSKNEELNHNIDFPSRTASDSLAINNRPKLSTIKTVQQIRPFNYLFQPVDPHQFSSHNNNETEKRRLTDQISENTHGANFSECSIDKYAPVNYGTITKNNQISIPSGPNIQHTPETRPSIIITNNGAKRKCIPSVPTSKLTPENMAMLKKSGRIYKINKTSEPVESMSNNEQNGFPQTSNSNSENYTSSFAKYMPKTHDTQLMPNPRQFENREETEIVNHPTYDTPMVSSFQFTNEAENHYFTFQEASESIPPAYRMCNPSSHNLPLTQFSPIGNSIKPGIPKLSAHEVVDEHGICPVILHPNKQLSSQVQMKSDALIKTIGFAPARSQMTAQAQSRIVTTSLQRSIMESQNVSPLIITPSSHVIHSANEIVPAKIVPIPSAPAVSHFSVINKTGSYDNIPEYTGIRQSLVSGTPPVYTQSDFARFPPKSYHHKNAVVNPAVIHGPIPGNIDEPCINIPNSQHVFKPIISPRPSILRKRDADGVLRAQKNLIPILTKPDIEECHNMDDTSLNRNGYSESGLQIESIMVPQIPEVRLLPQIAALARQSHIMVEISPRKKPRKQLLPVNQEDSPFKIVGDDMEYVDEKLLKIDKSDDFPEDDLICNDDLIDGDAEDEAEDDLDDMDVDDDCPADDDYDDDDDDFGNDFGDDFDYVKSDKTFFEDVKTSVEVSDESSACIKPKNKRPTLLGSYKNTWRGHTHHFQRYTDFKIKETKKQLADMQQAKKWTSDSISGWRVRHLLNQFDGMINIEEEIIGKMTELISEFEANIKDTRTCHTIVELIKDNIQRSKVSKSQLEEIRQQLKKIFDYKTLIDDVVDKHCPKDLKKKYAKVLTISKS
ncbi:uncharacterized protein LOC100162345 isoform X2 [Acyrthosiphon pisum]|uniref:Histone deacetylase complex subunit SAP130 C-terminal domain-containing protein n=1 Tax=Acyrthosiphon pisum TaxID=7029 RepID=A0A8R2D793_ACYPI|nr:uncharacterized protein LOC100162345 isoform X2 [Acyrthosiphon pisum]|eukprot:XP_016664585.1 PREDICTED: uncharacterized protein LOC100162345 isoform X2 [Acyrthosiphon pisum]